MPRLGSPNQGALLVDRTQETVALDALLAAVRLGMSGTLVLRGEAGIGKTALLDHTIASASDFRVVKAVGIESEMHVGFAGLHQLIVPFLPQLDRLPPTLRNALGVAFGLAAGPAPERFQVALATLTLLANAAKTKPLLCVIDDAQWFDIESAEVLGFVARRLHAEGIALLFGLRDPVERPIGFAGIPEMRLLPLLPSDARRLLATVSSASFDEIAAERVIKDTGGNPLAILELSDRGIAGWPELEASITEPLPLGERLQQHFLRQVGSMSADGQTFLRLVSAEPSLDPVVLWRAAEQLHLGQQAAAEAEAKGFIVVGPPLAFRHPLIRSAVYYGMPPAERRRLHAALAAATDMRFEADRHAGHRSLATVTPDEGVAAELAEAGQRAQQRGAYAAWAVFASRAADLTPDAVMRASRQLAASRAWMAVGRPDKAQASLSQAMPLLSDPIQRALAGALAGGIRFALGEGGETATILLAAARAMKPLDAALAEQILFNALEAATFSQPMMAGSVMRAIAAEALAGPETPKSAAGLLLRGYALVVTSGYAAAAPVLKQGIATTIREGIDPEIRHNLAILAAYSLFEDRSVHELATEWVRVTRERAALTAVPVALNFLASIEVYFGRADEAETLFRQSREVSEATGNPGIFGGASRGDVLLLCWQGNEASARAGAAAHMAEAHERDLEHWAGFAGFALAVLELALGRYEEALEQALTTYKDDPPFTGSWVLPNVIEAAARAGKRELAESALSRLTERALAGETPLGLGLLARSRALLADDADAESPYREAVDQLGRSPTRAELARAHLLYGEWLRRQNRRRDARDQLRTAYEMFSAMGFTAFAERARVELLATGERVRRRTIETQVQLSAQELQVARLAGQGVRNQQIASQLFISERTVEYHLAKVFRKLDVSSRTQLARAPALMGAGESTDPRSAVSR